MKIRYTYYQWHSDVHYCCIMYIHETETITSKQQLSVECYVGNAWVNSLSYADDVLLLAPTRYLLFRHSGGFLRHMLDLMTLYTTQRKQYVCWTDQRNHRVGTQKKIRLENDELSCVDKLCWQADMLTKDISLLLTVEMIKILIKKQFNRVNAVVNMLVRFNVLVQFFKSYCYVIYAVCLIWRHSYQNY